MIWLMGGFALGIGLGFWAGYKRCQKEVSLVKDNERMARELIFREFGLQVVKGEREKTN